MTKLMTPQISPTGKPQELFRTPIRHVVIIKTTTRQKTEQYAAAARYYGLPILFMDLSDIQDGFVVVDEDTNSRVDNAIKKAVDHDNVDAQLRDPTSALSKILRNRLSEYGIDYDGVKIHRAVEDSTMTTDLPEWKILHNLLSPYVPESMLHGIAKNGTQAGPAAETGQVMSSSTLHYLMEGTRRSHLRLKRRELGKTKGDKAQKPIVSSPNITSVTTFILSTLDADMTPEKIFTGETQYKIIIPDGLENPIPKPAARISESEDYYARPDNLRMAENSHHLEWLLKRSPRGKIVRQIAEHLGIPVPEIDVGQLFSVSASTTFIRRKWPMKNPEIVSFGAGDDRIGRFRIKLHVPETITPEALNIEGLLEKTDAMIFRGIGDLSDDQKTLYRLHYYAALVDRQTRARAKHRPMIVVDDGSLSTLIDFGIKLYDKGFVKNHLNRPVYQGKSAIVSDPDIDHFSDGYMDVIRSNTGKPLTPLQERAAINQILEFRLASYVPFVAPTPEPTMPKVGGAAIHPDDVTVTFYTSATNDNRKVIDSNKGYGKFLAEQGFAAAYGGGDLHAMGAFAGGYKDGGGHHITAVSTYTLLLNETSRGKVAPGTHRWEIYPDITQRRDRLYHLGDIEVVAWGGYGTMEEEENGQAWRKADPKLAANKYKIFFAPGIHPGDTSPNINTDLMREEYGDAFVDALLKDPRSQMDKGYALATHDDELKALTLEMRARIIDYRAEHGVRVGLPKRSGVSSRRAQRLRVFRKELE